MDAGSGVEPSPPREELTPRRKANNVWNEFMSEAYQTGERYEKQYGIPARKKLVTVGSAYPFTTALGVVFLALALFPILIFLGFSAFILTTFLSTALIFAIIFAGTIIVGAGTLLLGVMSMTFGFSLFLTVSGFMAFITYRLYFHLREPDGRGLGAWKAETMMRFGLVDVAGMRGALASSGSRPALPNGKPVQ
ncbi:transmembrane protein [Ceratobasidium sp. AG-Ba]|nr:transmembrane protein [Ceratobasidium sp. AG-Ba]QRV98861.1 transmembrane protein [Ceratobasidium sp. AG-Ba]